MSIKDKKLSEFHKDKISEGVNKVLTQKYYPKIVKILKAEYITETNKQDYLEGDSKKHTGNYSIGVVLDVVYNQEIEGLTNGIKKGIYNMRSGIKSLPTQFRNYLFTLSNFTTFTFNESDILWNDKGIFFDSIQAYKEAIGIFPAKRRADIGKSNHKQAQLAPRSDAAKQKISKKVSKPVLCLNTGIIYSSQTVAAEALDIKQSTISDICRSFKNFGVTPSGRKLKRETREGTQFMFLGAEDYEKFSDSRMVRCKTDGKVFFCYQDAADVYGIPVTNIIESIIHEEPKSSCVSSQDPTYQYEFSNIEVSRYKPGDANNNIGRFIRCITNMKFYADIGDATDDTGFEYDEIMEVCSGKVSNMHGYTFDFVKIIELAVTQEMLDSRDVVSIRDNHLADSEVCV